MKKKRNKQTKGFTATYLAKTEFAGAKEDHAKRKRELLPSKQMTEHPREVVYKHYVFAPDQDFNLPKGRVQIGMTHHKYPWTKTGVASRKKLERDSIRVR